MYSDTECAQGRGCKEHCKKGDRITAYAPYRLNSMRAFLCPVSVLTGWCICFVRIFHGAYVSKQTWAEIRNLNYHDPFVFFLRLVLSDLHAERRWNMTGLVKVFRLQRKNAGYRWSGQLLSYLLDPAVIL